MKGTFANADHALWPGLFVQVTLVLRTDPNAIVVPAAAVQASQAGQFVFVVKADRTVEVRNITVERQQGDEIVVAQGLKPGEEVVTDGQLRLTAGARVTTGTRGEGPAEPAARGPRGTGPGRRGGTAWRRTPRRESRESVMNFAETFIRRPVATTLLVTTILIFGVLGYRLLPVSDLPTIDYPTIQVQANLPGASPSTMAASVATPLEKQFSTIAGVTSISSNNGQGNTNITLQFDLSRDIDSAAQDVQSMIARAARSLPPGMPSPPSYQKVNPADQPILFLTLSSSTMPMSLVDQYAESVLAQRLSMVSGVAGVNVFGAQKFAVRIDVDPTQLASRQIGIDQVAQAIAGANVNRPTGTLYGPKRNFVVQTSGQLMAAEEYRPIPVAYRNGSPVRLERSRQRLRRRREPAERQLVQRHADHLSRHLTAAGHQHRPGRRRDQGAAARAAEAAARGARARHPQRPIGVHPRVGRRRQVHAAS